MTAPTRPTWDRPVADVEADAKRIAAQQLLPEQALDMDSAHTWWSRHPFTDGTKGDAEYPGWAERIAAIQRLNEDAKKRALTHIDIRTGAAS